jgi:hypothetical protein
MIYEDNVYLPRMASLQNKFLGVIFAPSGLEKAGEKKNFTLSPIKILYRGKSTWPLPEFWEKFQFYQIPVGCTKAMQPIDQGLAERIQFMGKDVTSIRALHQIVQQTINEAWIKQL